MKKLFILLSTLAWSTSIFGQPNIWSQKIPYPGGLRGAPVAFGINKKGYVMTGLNASNVSQNDMWEWNKTTNVWTQRANLPGPSRYSAVAFTINGKGYITTGWVSPSSALQDLWQYNNTTNIWTQKTNLAGVARYTASCFVISGYAYVGLGYGPILNDFWKYDPTLNSWAQIASFPAGGRQSAIGFSTGGYGYITGGYPLNNELWQYNPANNSWLQKANFPGAPRYAGASFVLNGNGIVGAGFNGSTYYNDFYSYNPTSNLWSTIPALPGQGRSSCASLSVDGSGFICCGQKSGGYMNEFWEYGQGVFGILVTGTNISCNGGNNGSATANTSGGSLPYTYQWSPGGQTTGTLLNLSTGVYSVVVTDGTGATLTGSVTITEPSAISSTATSATICEGQYATLNVSVSGGMQPYTYSWSPNPSTINVLTVNPTVTTVYSVFITDANGCQNLATSPVIVNPLPAATITASNGGIACYPATVKLSAPNNPGYSWKWKKNGVNISGATDSVYHAASSGAYKAIVTNSSGCSKLSNNINVTIAQVAATVSPWGNISICAGDSVALYAIPSSGYNYKWKKNGINISGATLSVYQAKQTGTYKVVVTDAVTGCTALSPGTVITVNCRDGKGSGMVKIFPNPASDRFTLVFSSPDQEAVTFSIFDVTGRHIKTYNQIPADQSYYFGEDLLPGIYVMKIEEKNQETVLELIKTR